HAARTMERARHPAIAGELANIAQIDEHHVTAPAKLDRVGRLQRFDLPLSGFHHVVSVHHDFLRHYNLRITSGMVLARMPHRRHPPSGAAADQRGTGNSSREWPVSR